VSAVVLICPQHRFAGGGFSPWLGILIMVPLANLLCGDSSQCGMAEFTGISARHAVTISCFGSCRLRRDVWAEWAAQRA